MEVQTDPLSPPLNKDEIFWEMLCHYKLPSVCMAQCYAKMLLNINICEVQKQSLTTYKQSNFTAQKYT